MAPPAPVAMGMDEFRRVMVKTGNPVLATVGFLQMPGCVKLPLTDPVPLSPLSMVWRKGFSHPGLEACAPRPPGSPPNAAGWNRLPAAGCRPGSHPARPAGESKVSRRSSAGDRGRNATSLPSHHGRDSWGGVMTGTTAPRRRGRWIEEWDPEDEAFWRRTGERTARRNLVYSVLSEHIGFSIWSLWSVMVLFMGPEYGIDPAGKFFLIATATFVGASCGCPTPSPSPASAAATGRSSAH